MVVEILCIIVDMLLRWKIAQRFELLWWKQYLASKNKVEYLTWKKNYWQDLLVQLLGTSRLPSDKTVIDLGCGPSGVYVTLCSNRVVAVDPLLDAYEKELDFFKQSDYPHVDFKNSTIEEYVDEKTYDYVFCLNAINHVANISVATQKISDLVAQNGKLVFSIDAHNYSFFKTLFRWMPGDILHPHQYDLAEYEKMLDVVGLRVEKTIKLKQEFFFDHYVLLASKSVAST